jgi:ATP/maltotriose-dependent transcriptional regulator MalT
LDRLSPVRVEGFYSLMVEHGLAPSSVLLAPHVLSGALQAAVRRGLLVVNVCRLVDKPSRTAGEVEPLTLVEVRRVLDAASAALTTSAMTLSTVAADARSQLRVAVDHLDRSNAAPWAERARAELNATGLATPRPGRTGLLRLTPQELQVARLAAQGLSNRDIAAQLFLSPRTVATTRTRLTRSSASPPAASSSRPC